MQEVWKDVLGFEGVYKVSNLGRVKTMFRYGRHRQPIHQDRILALGIAGKYATIGLYRGGTKKSYLVHRLVLSAFTGPSGLQVNHKNGIKMDNRLVNLEWATPQENVVHALKSGLSTSYGERHGMSKLSSDQVSRIKEKLAMGKTGRSLAVEFGVCPATISCINIGKTRLRG